MSTSTIRKALGAVKDQTSIGLAKVTSNIAPELEVAIVKATGHDNDPAEEKHLREILSLTSYSRGYVGACIATISRRLGKTHDWIVALKSLMLIHRLLAEGDPAFHHEILYATRRGTRLLNMSDFRDEAHSNSWDHSAFVRTYALYLDQRLECMVYERKQGGGGGGGGSNDRRPPLPPSQYSDYGGEQSSPYGGNNNRDRYSYTSPRQNNDTGYSYTSPQRNGDPGYEERQRGEEKKPPTPLQEMKPERVLGKMHQLQQLLDRLLACRPTGLAKNCRLIIIALYQIVRESFQIYADVCEILAVLLDRFFDMEYADCVKSFEAYASSAKQIDELSAFYGWCKEMGVARSSEYPEVQRITDKLLETLEEFMRDRAKRPKSPPRAELPAPPPVDAPVEEEQDSNAIKALPAPSDYEEKPIEREPVKPPPPKQQEDLVNLRDEAASAEDQSNRLALALFSSGGATAANKSDGSWEAFDSQGGSGEGQMTSAWQNPAADPGKADWELALVESASHLSKQKAELPGGFDPLLLNGMYDQGAVRQHVNSQVNGGSASSVALPGLGQKTTQVLALPAPDGTVQAIGHDPFAASVSIPPPSYVQMADMEKKQQFLTQEQVLWQQYANNGMQGQGSLAKLSNGYQYPNYPMPYGMQQPPLNGAGGYYYASY